MNVIEKQGFDIINKVYTQNEIQEIISKIEKVDTDKLTFRKTNDLFAIRQFFKEVPEVLENIFNENLKKIINQHFSSNYFITKSIYFDKPPLSNWFVSYHQDLTISVNKKIPVEGFKNWTVKQNQFSVMPPISILEQNFTVRIHLDETTAHNLSCGHKYFCINLPYYDIKKFPSVG